MKTSSRMGWKLIKIENGHYVSRDERFTVTVVTLGSKNDHWLLFDRESGRKERFSTKKTCQEAVRSRYRYWEPPAD